MNAAGLVVSALLFVPAAVADDAPVRLTLEGRPVDNRTGNAVMHHGLVFADIIDLTRTFDGLITLRRDGSAMITVGPNTGTFTPNSGHALINDVSVVLPSPPFRHHGDLFIPLGVFCERIADVVVQVDDTRRWADIHVANGL